MDISRIEDHTELMVKYSPDMLLYAYEWCLSDAAAGSNQLAQEAHEHVTHTQTSNHKMSYTAQHTYHHHKMQIINVKWFREGHRSFTI